MFHKFKGMGRARWWRNTTGSSGEFPLRTLFPLLDEKSVFIRPKWIFTLCFDTRTSCKHFFKRRVLHSRTVLRTCSGLISLFLRIINLEVPQPIKPNPGVTPAVPLSPFT